jgi:hypothetical protein
MLLTRGRGGDYIEPSASTPEAVRIQIEKEWESESESIDDPKIRPETEHCRPVQKEERWDSGRSAACKKRGGIW